MLRGNMVKLKQAGVLQAGAVKECVWARKYKVQS